MPKDRNITVLHVEDDSSLQRLVRAALRSLRGLTVQTAGDGYQALEAARAAAPDLILLDERLPRMSGSDTFDALRGLPGLSDTPIIFLTASTDPQTHDKLVALGAQDILVKPCRPQLLISAVRLALGMAEKTQSPRRARGRTVVDRLPSLATGQQFLTFAPTLAPKLQQGGSS